MKIKKAQVKAMAGLNPAIKAPRQRRKKSQVFPKIAFYVFKNKSVNY
jgi:hypothetical protein